MLLRAHPKVPVAPSAEFPQLRDFRVVRLDVVFHGEALGVVDADVAAEAEEEAGCFERQKFGVGSSSVSLWWC